MRGCQDSIKFGPRGLGWFKSENVVSTMNFSDWEETGFLNHPNVVVEWPLLAFSMLALLGVKKGRDPLWLCNASFFLCHRPNIAIQGPTLWFVNPGGQSQQLSLSTISTACTPGWAKTTITWQPAAASNFFVHFSGELRIPKSPFEMNRHLPINYFSKLI